MPPIRLSDSELDAVMAAARPLPIHLRDPFLHAVAHALSDPARAGTDGRRGALNHQGHTLRRTACLGSRSLSPRAPRC